MMYEKTNITSFDVAQMIALRELVQCGTMTVDELKEFADVIARVSEFLFKMRDVIQAHEELSACNAASDAQWKHCDMIDADPLTDEKACALDALVNLGRVVYSKAVHDCFRPLGLNDAGRAVREQCETILTIRTERLLQSKTW